MSYDTVYDLQAVIQLTYNFTFQEKKGQVK